MNIFKDSVILLAEDDDSIAEAVKSYLSEKGLNVIRASNGSETIELYKSEKPECIVTDLRMPEKNGLEVLSEVRKIDNRTPVIIITGYPEVDSALEAIHNGAFDFIQKPFSLNHLYQKIVQAVENSYLRRENVALSRMVSLHEITKQISSINNLAVLFDFLVKICSSTFGADEILIGLVSKKDGSYHITDKKESEEYSKNLKANIREDWKIIVKVLKTSRGILLKKDGRLTGNKEDYKTRGNIICVPMRISEEVEGFIFMLNDDDSLPFNKIDLESVEILASHTAIAAKNDSLYNTITRKLDEFKLMSTYSKKLIGMMEIYKVIKEMFQTVNKNFPVDFCGFMFVQKRYHSFFYYSNRNISGEFLSEIIDGAIKKYNKKYKPVIQKKRVTPRQVLIENTDVSDETVSGPFKYVFSASVSWEDFNFGSVIFGSFAEPAQKNELNSLISNIVTQSCFGLANAKLYSDMKKNYIRTIKALAIAVDAKDTYTHGHSENVMNIAEEIAVEMGLDEKWIRIIRDAGLLHDIGKIGIPGYILNKPGPLSREEFDGVMKSHCMLGANIIKDVPFLEELYGLILYHHENYNGSGYPEGLKKEEIPMGARILRVADAFDAMTSNRPYRDSLGKKEAFKRLRQGSGNEFDVNVINTFFRMAEKKGWILNSKKMFND